MFTLVAEVSDYSKRSANITKHHLEIFNVQPVHSEERPFRENEKQFVSFVFCFWVRDGLASKAVIAFKEAATIRNRLRMEHCVSFVLENT